MTSDAVLVTGAFGLVGRQTVLRVAASGRPVVATSRDSKANRKAARRFPPNVTVHWADLTDGDATRRMIAAVTPAAIVHLAAVIPPDIYRNPGFARRVNVEATESVVRAAEALPEPPRFVHASSMSVYGPRNPHRCQELVRADTPLRPYDAYGRQKAESERIVRSSRLDWTVLRLGGVLSHEPGAMGMGTDNAYFSSLLPADSRLHTVDARDAAWALAAATTADIVGEILLVAGDESHKIANWEVTAAMMRAAGLGDAPPPSRPGNPDSDDDWYPAADWMDTSRAQEALGFQHVSWDQMIADYRREVGWRRYPLRLAAPLARAAMKRNDAFRGRPGPYTDPWGAIRARWGEPLVDG
ncbi:NAD-dependent epimerase/dehydratase family protein [Mycolicibacterium aubagnense]|uniref:Oxidoreductase n=1 Tax=Mycolicibacterium aubagnense TaxID=319707 RepID=A0ABM7I9S2_9MYCO|nr:NAD(P)-dependent oxidoreductase [Mycolicibacterium aubagnense]TLH59516.1 oxidoreductase [Mycolicibacterium aubagnense]WGI34640.1 NAD(P)-dependent oxidoreductase [Mycolicibacterium aubagnense]BBX83476.1 oxidoreductase [Mycolicibacterium aubagnense]